MDPSGSKRIFKTQLRWLEDRLRYAQDHQAKQIYGKMYFWNVCHQNQLIGVSYQLSRILLAVFGHHPWFLYDEEEDPESLTGASPFPKEWESSSTPSNQTFPDSYFSMPRKYRSQALDLFQKYRVNACFSGHFHQNLVSKTRWGMDMIITGPLSIVFDSTGKKIHQEMDRPYPRRRKMTFESEEAMLFDSESSSQSSMDEPNCRGIRVVDVEVNNSSANSGFKHWFVPL